MTTFWRDVSAFLCWTDLTTASDSARSAKSSILIAKSDIFPDKNTPPNNRPSFKGLWVQCVTASKKLTYKKLQADFFEKLHPNIRN